MNNITAKIIKDSISKDGIRLSTIQTHAPKFLDAEFEKHRMISSNGSSDRAVPLETIVSRPFFVPEDVRLNQSGMQGNTVMSDDEIAKFHDDLIELHGHTGDILRTWNKVHKQHLNRYLLGFTWQDKVVTATEWENFFNLRIHKDAQPEIQELARCIKQAQDESEPDLLNSSEYHLPYVNLNDFGDPTSLGFDFTNAIKCSVARCARVSYLTHDKVAPLIGDDIKLYNMLCARPYDDGKGHILGEHDPVHLSPLEHVAYPMMHSNEIGYVGSWRFEPQGITHSDRKLNLWSGNFRGWVQYRQLV